MKKIFTLFFSLFLLAVAFGQSFKKLDSALKRDFPKNSEWVYYSRKGAVKKINSPEVRKYIANYAFYKVELTNFLCWPEDWTCLILFDSSKSKTILFTPIRYNEINKNFLNLFQRKRFEDSMSLRKFIFGLQSLMLIGSTEKCENTKYSKDKIKFDITFQSSKEKMVWRTIEISIADNTIQNIISIKPGSNVNIVKNAASNFWMFVKGFSNLFN